MTFRAIPVALLLSSLPIAGCGTVANLANQRPGAGGVAPFGGVHQDLACIQHAANGELSIKTHPKSESEQYTQRGLMLFCALDLPFSLIGDVVTWPYTAAYSFINQPIPNPPVLIADPPEAQPVPLPLPPTTQPMPIPVAPVAQASAKGQPKTSP